MRAVTVRRPRIIVPFTIQMSGGAWIILGAMGGLTTTVWVGVKLLLNYF